MSISAKVIEHSISPVGKEIVSFKLRYPKFIHAEAKTHRVIKVGSQTYEETFDAGLMCDPNLSRNASSSRAIPIERMIQDVMDDPVIPVYWGKHQKGMQADEEMTPAQIKLLTRKWLKGRDDAVALARTLMQDGLHKQIANRVLEPWFHITTLVTATEWDNFYELRLHKDAQPEMQALANAMAEAVSVSQPRLLNYGEWHLPFVTREERAAATIVEEKAALIEFSVARCARVSYLTQDGIVPRPEQDMALYERLVVAQPLHASPAEHQATPDRCLDVMNKPVWQHEDQWRNFKGWRQYRAMIDA